MLFNRPENLKKCPFPLGSGTTKFSLQSASRSVQPFCRAHERDQQTDKQTTLLRLYQLAAKVVRTILAPPKRLRLRVQFRR